MIIRIERSGGFAGMTLRTVIDSNRLDPQEARQLADLLESSNFFDTEISSTSEKGGGADRFHYSLTIEMGKQARSVELDESDIPSQWQALIEQINALARRFRR